MNSNTVKCLNDKGATLYISEHLLTPNYMRRHKLVIDEIKPLEELKPLAEAILEVKVEKAQAGEIVEDANEVVQLTRAEIIGKLNEFGIAFGKTEATAKLQEKLNAKLSEDAN